MKKILLSLLASSFFLLSCGGNSATDIINPDAEFLYFYGWSCPHCQELNTYVQEEDLFSKISVEKREVYANTINRDKFLALTKELGLSEKETGVPFVYDTVTKKHAVGVEPALELFKSRLTTITTTGSEVSENTAPEIVSLSGETLSSSGEEASSALRSDEIPAPIQNNIIE